MDYVRLKFLASKFNAYCCMNIEEITTHHIVLKSKRLSYLLVMDFKEDIPLLNIDTFDLQITTEIMEEVAEIIEVYNIFTVGDIKFC